MNSEQIAGQIRQLLPIIGTVATAFGVLSATDSAALVSNLSTIVTGIATLVGPVMIVGSMLWSYFSKTDKNIVAAAAPVLERLDPVKGKIVTAAPELRGLVNDPAVPNVVAPKP